MDQKRFLHLTFEWFLRWSLRWKLRSQNWHWCFRSVVWMRRWRISLNLEENALEHSLQANGRSPVCEYMCWNNLPGLLNAFSQRPHWWALVGGPSVRIDRVLRRRGDSGAAWGVTAGHLCPSSSWGDEKRAWQFGQARGRSWRRPSGSSGPPSAALN